jgi:hypothetical protein
MVVQMDIGADPLQMGYRQMMNPGPGDIGQYTADYLVDDWNSRKMLLGFLRSAVVLSVPTAESMAVEKLHENLEAYSGRYSLLCCPCYSANYSQQVRTSGILHLLQSGSLDERHLGIAEKGKAIRVNGANNMCKYE